MDELEDPVSPPHMMVLCGACSDAIPADAGCPTCGEPNPLHPAEDLDEDTLLARVTDALGAQSELSRATAAERITRASELYDRTLLLRRRLRHQAAMMRRLMAERRELQRTFERPLGSVDQALADSAGDASRSTRRVVDVLLPHDRTCGVVARRVLEDHVNGEVAREVVDGALLVATELATNAARYGIGTIELRSAIREVWLQIEVCDEGTGEWLGVLTQGGYEAKGRGLWLVEQLSETWGAQTCPTRVWAELLLRSSPNQTG